MTERVLVTAGETPRAGVEALHGWLRSNRAFAPRPTEATHA